MWAANFVFWACSLVGLSCGAGAAPNVSTIQSAYEREASSGGSLHDKGLKVVDASCDDLAGGQFLCQITYVSAADPTQRLYFDVVGVEKGDAGWRLKSGLCKR